MIIESKWMQKPLIIALVGAVLTVFAAPACTD